MTLTKKQAKQANKDLKKGIIRCGNCFKIIPDLWNIMRIKTNKDWSRIVPLCKDCYNLDQKKND